MKPIMLTAISVLAGFAGGVLGSRLNIATEQQEPERVVRARSFELVDAAGRAISIWGVNKQGHTLLAFLGSQYVPGEKADHSFGLDDPLKQRAAIGVTGDTPILTYKGADGRLRMILGLNGWQKPFLLMEDENGPRVALGVNQSDTPSVQQSDWALSFQPDRAWIGMSSQPENGQQYVRGFVLINKDKVKFP